MLGRESPQRSFLDAAWSAESLLEGEGFYEVLYREGPRLYPDEFFAECYTLDNGRPSVPPSRMMKLLLLQSWEDLSDREALERMRFDLRWKAVLGMEVGEPSVAQSTLVEFRARLQVHEKMEEAFERFLERAVEAGLLDAEEAQVIDSTAVWGRGAVEDTYRMIGSAVRKLLGACARSRDESPEAVSADVSLKLTAPAEQGSLKGRAGIDWSAEEERRAFLNELVREARTLLAETREEQAADPEVREAAGLLARILCQDLEPVSAETEREGGGPSDPELPLSGRDASEPTEEGEPEDPVLAPGQPVQIRRGVATDRVVSVSDPEMRHGHKSRQRKWDGYKAHVSVGASSELVTAVDVTPANGGDAGAAPALLEAQRRVGLRPEANVGDMAYSAAALRAEAERQGTKIVARVPPARAPGGRFSKDTFTLDLEDGTATCPAGEVTSRRYRRGEGGLFAFDGATCAACRLRERCTSKDPEKMRATGRGRTVNVHPRERMLQAVRQEEETDAFGELMGLRPVVERKIAHLTRRGLRQARYSGTAKTLFQALATGLTANMARLGALFRADPARKSRWAAACGAIA